jgi:uncharacterized membrane protein
MSDVPSGAPADDERSLAGLYRSSITVLSVGFKTGAGLLVLGLVVALLRREPLNDRVDSFEDVPRKLLEGSAAGIIDLAILAIMATPLATVVTVAIGFFRAGDRRYGWLSLVVLGILGISVILALIR